MLKEDGGTYRPCFHKQSGSVTTQVNSHTPAMECSVNRIIVHYVYNFLFLFFAINDRAGYYIYCSHILTGTPMPASRHSRKVDWLHTQSITISDCAQITCPQKHGC